MRIATVLLLSAALMGCKHSNDSAAEAPTTLPSPIVEHTRAAPTVTEAIRLGVDYLVKSQQPSGCWGTGLETRGTEIYSMVPGSHDAYRVATTALCVMALREAGEQEARAKGVEYLVTSGEARRDSGDLLYNIWAHTFALQALAVEMRYNPDPRVAAAAKWHLDRMIRYATYTGGWNYYDFNVQTQSPSLDATSFGTAAGLFALYEARQSKLEVPQRLIDMSVRRLEECRSPTGTFYYGVDSKYHPRSPANLPQGAIGRTQPSNYSLWVWDSKVVGQKQSIEGLDLFFKYHVFLENGRKRPFPHETWYQTSGYYYYFDHYFAAMLIQKLPAKYHEKYVKKLLPTIMPHQEIDGSWWDYAMWDYHKPYGTAFAVMSLLRCEQMLSPVKAGG